MTSGPSVRIHTSPRGGVFEVFVDGFNTSTPIDTYSPEDPLLPLCYPVQFPPFVAHPPDLATIDHIITLVYTGPSPRAPAGTNSSEVQFDSFAIPELEPPYIASGSASVGRDVWVLLPSAGLIMARFLLQFK